MNTLPVADSSSTSSSGRAAPRDTSSEGVDSSAAEVSCAVGGAGRADPSSTEPADGDPLGKDSATEREKRSEQRRVMVETLPRNVSPDFVGIDGLKRQNAEQVALFESWARTGRWHMFGPSYSHYDWWVAPIDARSSYGTRYTVLPGDIAELSADEEFMDQYRKGIALVFASWGWDLPACRPVEDKAPSQSWRAWGVRLYKNGRSLQLFGEHELLDSADEFVCSLLRAKTSGGIVAKTLTPFSKAERLAETLRRAKREAAT